jgi:hypothetical protein
MVSPRVEPLVTESFRQIIGNSLVFFGIGEK